MLPASGGGLESKGFRMIDPNAGVTRRIIGYVIGMAAFLPFSFAEANFSSLPGAQAFSSNLQAELASMWAKRQSDEPARTHHLNADGTPVYVNRLMLQDSPYLRQHAHNPVDWHAWGQEAFAEARRRDVPLLISIGYSTCYWCHVMEQETYDNIAVAELVNQNLIAIKVDRETHPEIDNLYITAVEAMGGAGGWPLNVFATPDGEPFFAGTYFTNEQFRELVGRVSVLWGTERQTLIDLANHISDVVRSYALLHIPDAEVGPEAVARAMQRSAEYQRMADDFELTGNQFPRESELFLLADAAIRNGDTQAAELLHKRLEAMALGGIRDHVGGGFHRYSIDNKWLVPHFEKMLYNQAHLGRLYLYGYQISGNSMFKRTAVETLNFVLSEMTSPQGGFFSAFDAGEPGKEGEFYVWTMDQVVDALPPEQAGLIGDLYGVSEAGNFEGLNILHLSDQPESYAKSQGIPVEELLGQVAEFRAQLADIRRQRLPPFRDIKIISSWNGMMIKTLAEASRILDDRRYLQAAERAAEFIWRSMLDETGSMKRIFINERAMIAGKLDDYAYFAQAMLAVHDQTGRDAWLRRSQAIVDRMLDLFWDPAFGGLFSIAETDSAGLIARPKDHIDDALPSGNSVAAEVLTTLYRRTGLRKYQDWSKQVIGAFAGEVAEYPENFTYLLKAMQVQMAGTAGEQEYAAHGNIRLVLRSDRVQPDEIAATVTMNIADGWHVNSDEPLSDFLIATSIQASPGWEVASIGLPEPIMLGTQFLDVPMAVFDGVFDVSLKLQRIDESAQLPKVEVTLQACDDAGQCLLPETVVLEPSAVGRFAMH